MRSISIPLRTSLMIGTNESGTAVKDVTAPGPAIRSNTAGKYSKKSSRVTCLGATARVSISDPAHKVSSCFPTFENMAESYLAQTLPSGNYRMGISCLRTGRFEMAAIAVSG